MRVEEVLEGSDGTGKSGFPLSSQRVSFITFAYLQNTPYV